MQAGSVGLVRPKRMPLLKRPTDHYYVELELAQKASPANEKELFAAITCILKGLRPLHKATPIALVHRDVRWVTICLSRDRKLRGNCQGAAC